MFPNGTRPIGANWGTNNGLITIRANDVYDITDDSNGRSAPADVTTVLTVTNVTISDNGTDYVCTQGLVTPAVSSVAFLTVVGKQINIPYCLDYKLVLYKCWVSFICQSISRYNIIYFILCGWIKGFKIKGFNSFITTILCKVSSWGEPE